LILFIPIEDSKIKKEIEVKRCSTCTFNQYSMSGAYCIHPFWNDKNTCDNILSINEVLNKKCPLLKEDLIIRYRIK
jgi:hypothetical protein